MKILIIRIANRNCLSACSDTGPAGGCLQRQACLQAGSGPGTQGPHCVPQLRHLSAAPGGQVRQYLIIIIYLPTVKPSCPGHRPQSV